ncbi:hypothetical protein C8Q80DRAFT_416807 [Daedaleopsis nitida]|nr:hypothetical protein C8Q80DRAFT_416807 [Daedaleopsis nitida]
MTWIDGDCCENVWQSLTPRDKKRIVSELRTLIGIIRERTAGHTHPICATSGHPISDPRVPWASEDLRTFSSPREFFEQVWLGLDFPHLRNTIAPVIRPLVTREDIPIVFCHGDIYPKNIILPGGLAQWRAGTTSLHLIDWELSGWMPLPWEALKATWLICDHEEDEWYAMMQDVFPESSAELEADWLWRTQSNIPIL